MPPETFEQIKISLLALGGYRVWSLMVTLFGDLAQCESSRIEGPVLSAIMQDMDIRPEAVRVALHRLRNDGWISSWKTGRTGQHALTPTSRKETTQASERIYGSPTSFDDAWNLVLIENPTDSHYMQAHGFIPLAPRVYLGCAKAKTPNDALVLTGNQVPEWLRAQISHLMLEDDYAALLPILQHVERNTGSGALTPRQIAVLRCLLVHNWRRIVLRHPVLPRAILPPNWSGHACHLLIDRLLNRFPRPAINTILAE